MSAPSIAVSDLRAGYFPGVPIVDGVSMTCKQGEAVALIGPNGAGKSTLVKAIMGLTSWSTGQVSYKGQVVRKPTARAMIELGLAYVPQGHEVFGTMSVRSNLESAFLATDRPRRSRTQNDEAVDRVVEELPMLEEFLDRKASRLSGGQQQLVSLGRALMTQPEFLLVDEPTAGLSPAFSDTVFSILSQLRSKGAGIFLVEQNATRALEFADHGIVLDLGQVAWSEPADVLLKSDEVKQLYVGGRPRSDVKGLE